MATFAVARTAVRSVFERGRRVCLDNKFKAVGDGVWLGRSVGRLMQAQQTHTLDIKLCCICHTKLFQFFCWHKRVAYILDHFACDFGISSLAQCKNGGELVEAIYKFI